MSKHAKIQSSLCSQYKTTNRRYISTERFRPQSKEVIMVVTISPPRRDHEDRHFIGMSNRDGWKHRKNVLQQNYKTGKKCIFFYFPNGCWISMTHTRLKSILSARTTVESRWARRKINLNRRKLNLRSLLYN